MLITDEAEMHKSTSQAKMFEGYVSKISMDIDNGKIGSPEKVSLHNGKGSAKVKPFDHMVKRKASLRYSHVLFLKGPYVSIAY